MAPWLPRSVAALSRRKPPPPVRRPHPADLADPPDYDFEIDEVGKDLQALDRQVAEVLWRVEAVAAQVARLRRRR